MRPMGLEDYTKFPAKSDTDQCSYQLETSLEDSLKRQCHLVWIQAGPKETNLGCITFKLIMNQELLLNATNYTPTTSKLKSPQLEVEWPIVKPCISKTTTKCTLHSQQISRKTADSWTSVARECSGKAPKVLSLCVSADTNKLSSFGTAKESSDGYSSAMVQWDCWRTSCRMTIFEIVGSNCGPGLHYNLYFNAQALLSLSGEVSKSFRVIWNLPSIGVQKGESRIQLSSPEPIQANPSASHEQQAGISS
ncbi:hypothetical protein EV361DRAFT_85283 [Lentinula raphanica]|nr:hypothetical protein EV361DRAFT_85283 [Lentinula raphanica]